jgi:hypothetical protein
MEGKGPALTYVKSSWQRVAEWSAYVSRGLSGITTMYTFFLSPQLVPPDLF